MKKIGGWSAPVRHLILVFIAAGVTALADNLDSMNIPVTWLPFITGGLAIVLAWLTPLVQSYGLGQLTEGP